MNSDLQTKIKLILEDVQDYWLTPERYTQPMKDGEITFVEQFMQLFEEHQKQSNKESLSKFIHSLPMDIQKSISEHQNRIQQSLNAILEEK